MLSNLGGRKRFRQQPAGHQVTQGRRRDLYTTPPKSTAPAGERPVEEARVISEMKSSRNLQNT
jgi:hypothetical protein